ncbi:unnamed protein product, partial [Ixodes pacificus]
MNFDVHILSSVCGADRIALCFFFTSSTLACILSINTQLTSAKNSSMKLAPSSTVTETSSSPCA